MLQLDVEDVGFGTEGIDVFSFGVIDIGLNSQLGVIELASPATEQVMPEKIGVYTMRPSISTSSLLRRSGG